MPESESMRWSAAMDRALYGPDGFYVAGDGAVGHFRTSVSGAASVRAVFAVAIGELLARVDAALSRPDPLDLVDVAAGSGDLLTAVLDSIGSGLAARVRPTVVELRPRPEAAGQARAAQQQVNWLDGIPEITGLLIANEWLDNVPIDVVDDDRVQLVDSGGSESPGPPPAAVELAWLARWWPSGQRREIGLRRDIAWAEAMSRVRRGLAVAIDYTHTVEDRPTYGTLTGFRQGREIEPIPDGSCDVTAHVAIDSLLAAGERAVEREGRKVRSMVTDQRSALRSLGVTGRRPAYAADPGGDAATLPTSGQDAIARQRPGEYAAALQHASDSAELIDAAGLGAFTWLLQGVDVAPTELLR